MNILKAIFGGAGVGTLTAAEAKTRLAGDTAPLVLDVRQPDEFRMGHIQGARLIPLNELGTRLPELPKARAILCVCRSGARSASAARQLASAGYEVLNLQGGMMAWEQAGFAVKKGNQ